MPEKTGRKVSIKMEEFVTVLQGKALREFAARLVTGKFTIEKQSLNRYKVIEGESVNGVQDYTLVNRRTFVLLDKELYKLQAKDNPLQACIDRAWDENLCGYVDKESIDAMNAKLIARTLSKAKVFIKDVTISTSRTCYFLQFGLVQSISERELTVREQSIIDMFNNAKVFNESKLKTPPAETITDAVDTTAETIPVKK